MKLKRVIKSVSITFIALAVIAAGVFLYARFVEPSMLKTITYTLQSDKITQNMRIVSVSDLHVGNGTDAQRISEVMTAVAQQNPDVIVFLGDFYDNYNAHKADDAEQIIAALTVPELTDVPKYAIFGNHDYGGGAKQAYRQVLEQAGFTILINQSVQLGGNITLSGSDDMIFGRPDIEDLPQQDSYNILLAHEPDIFASTEGFDLQLSGHTHGGQIKLPIISNLSSLNSYLLPPGGRMYVRGLYERPDGASLIVNSGVGMSVLKLRFFVPPEINVIDMAAAQ